MIDETLSAMRDADGTPAGVGTPAPAGDADAAKRAEAAERRKAQKAAKLARLEKARAARAAKKAAAAAQPAQEPDEQKPVASDAELRVALGELLHVVWAVLRLVAYPFGFRAEKLTDDEAADIGGGFLPWAKRWRPLALAAWWMSAPRRLVDAVAKKFHRPREERDGKGKAA